MYAFIDESGVQLKTGHSTVALVLIEAENLPQIDEAIKAVEAKIGPKTFHWSKMRWDVRLLAFRELQKLPFTFHIAVFTNPTSNADEAIAETLGRLLLAQTIESIYVDGRKSRSYESKLKSTLRKSGITTRKLKTVNDEAFPAIRIADLLAGLYRHILDKSSPESARLQKLVEKKQQ